MTFVFFLFIPVFVSHSLSVYFSIIYTQIQGALVVCLVSVQATASIFFRSWDNTVGYFQIINKTTIFIRIQVDSFHVRLTSLLWLIFLFHHDTKILIPNVLYRVSKI